MSIGIALYAFAVAIGVVISGGIIEISENTHTQNIQHQDIQSHMAMSSDLDSDYYPSENNISITVGDDQTFSVYPNIPWFTTWKVDGQRVMAANDESSGQTYIAFTYPQIYDASILNIGVHKIEVDNVIDKHIWYLTVTNISEEK